MSTPQGHPIHLWDACNGALRCTYRAYNAVDEITAAYCASFSGDGTKVVAGYNKVRPRAAGMRVSTLCGT